MKKLVALLLSLAIVLSLSSFVIAENEVATPLKFIFSTSYTFPDGEDENNNAYIKAIEEATNTEIEVTYVPNSDVLSKVTTIIASGDEYDLLKLNCQNNEGMNTMSRLISEGAVAPLTDAIQRVAPELLDLINPDALPYISSKGEIYAMPTYQMPGNQILYIRQDWLDNLGLSMPETLDEAKEVLRMFKEDDPDKDGIDDTIGTVIASAIGNHSGAWFGAFGTQYGIWQEDQGSLVYSNVSDKMRNALEWFHALYEDGLLDERFTVSATADIREMVSTGQCGYVVMGWSETRTSIENAVKNDGAVWAFAPFPVGEDGSNGIAERSLIHTLYFVPATSKNVDKMIEVFAYGASAFQDLCYYGAEGEIRQMDEQGKIILKDDMHKKYQYRSEYLPGIDYSRFAAEETARLADLGEYWHLPETLALASSAPINNAFNSLPSEDMSKLSSSLSVYELEAITEFITGERDLNEWDTWVDEWYALGGQRLVEIVNEWYNAQ